MLFLRSSSILLCVLFLLIEPILCSPVPQVLDVTATFTATAGLPGPTSTGSITESSYHFIGKVRFRTEPSNRGTIGIIVSCTATYIFCVWTTVHPNINETGKKRLRLWYKLVITLISIIVPAGVMICAFGEYRQAHRLVSEWEAYFTHDPTSNADPQKDAGSAAQLGQSVEETTTSDKQQKNTRGLVPLSMGTAFFIIMGGFRLELPDNTTPDRKAQRILNSKGFTEYLKAGHIDQHESFDQEEIQDKSKGNLIAKIFAGGQALWLILQSIARLSSGLPLTALEIHVLVQVLCTSIIYACWFRKPLDVAVPITIKLVNSPGSVNPEPDTYSEDPEKDPEEISKIGDIHSELAKHPSKQAPPAKLNTQTTTFSRSNAQMWEPQKPEEAFIPIAAKAFLDVGIYLRPNCLSKPGKIDAEGATNITKPKDDTLTNGGTRYSKRFDHRHSTTAMLLVEGFLVVLVAALHLSAWNNEFPSEQEKWLWRACCFSMIVFPSWIVAVIYFTDYDYDVLNILWSVQQRKTNTLELPPLCLREFHGAIVKRSTDKDSSYVSKLGVVRHYIFLYSCVVSVIVYMFAALFIAFESYFAIRYLSNPYFESPRWSNFIPHV